MLPPPESAVNDNVQSLLPSGSSTNKTVDVPIKSDAPPLYRETWDKPAEKEHAFHLNVADYSNAHLADGTSARARRQFESRIGAFLECLFESKYEHVPDDFVCPLEYYRHATVMEADASGKQTKVLKLAFRVADNVDQNFNDVAMEFCERVFSKKGSSLLGQLSNARLLGLSPVKHGEFARIWNSVFLLQVINGGGDLLKRIEDDSLASTDMPDWLTTLCFVTTFACGINFGSWAASAAVGLATTDAIRNLEIAKTLGASTVTVAAAAAAALTICNISMALLRRRAARARETDARTCLSGLGWKAKMDSYTRSIDRVLFLLNQQHEGENSVRARGELSDALLASMEKASMIFTANKASFEIYDKLQEVALKEAQEHGLLAAAHLGAAAALGAVAATTITTTTLVAAPVSGLMGLAVSTGLVSAPLVLEVSTVALWTPAAPLAVAALIGVAIWGALTVDSMLDKKKYAKKVAFFQNAHSLIIQAWQLADDTHLLLSWIYNTDREVPVFTEPANKKRWRDFIQRVREKSGAVPTAMDYTGQGLRDYLRARARDIVKWQVDMKRLEREFE